MMKGDPSWAGPLAGVALNLPVYHILEPEIRALIPSDNYEREIGLAAYTLDGEAIGSAVHQARESS